MGDFSIEYGNASVEVLDILDNTNELDIAKIPKKFIEFLFNNASMTYKVNFDHTKTIEELDISEKAKELLGFIYIKWLCNEDEKKYYFNQIRSNEKKKQEELKKIYDENEAKYQEKINEYKKDDWLSKRREKTPISTQIYEEKSEEKSIVVKKEKNFIEKIFDFIKNICRRNC